MKYRVVVKTMFGLEDVLVSELHEIGIQDVVILRRAVEFDADLEQIYMCNLHLRTALSVLVKIKQEEVHNEHELYRFIKSIEWDQYFTHHKTIAVSAVSISKTMTHSLFLEQKTKDAIVDYFRDKHGDRPSVDVKHPEVKISIYQTQDSCTVYLDSSGRPLYFRGFDKEIGQASINECLAAGIIYLSGWNKEDDFLDPMCGSGTFLSEAYMIARNIPATLQRKDFSFKNWENFDNSLWNTILKKAKSQFVDSNVKITGSDIDPEAVLLSKSNMYKIDKAHNVKIFPKSFFDLDVQSENGIIISNPPYGTRIKLDDSKEFYKQIGDKLKFGFSGFTAWLISSDLSAIKFVGMKPDKRVILYNGQLECRLVKFTIYKGSRRNKS